MITAGVSGFVLTYGLPVLWTTESSVLVTEASRLR
ncbi:hypothetical protein SAMN06264364_10247 [Quadrisphaera granulorum]|uniref:Uncharacterized protein n=1 Tax=Quadrisphaera granulorum TaxID=317664 RepID=A0A316AFK7_9ACTN|nr:hypothetical protein BXY45_10247 [Quadrisphaera granulorum]SZE95181.1 hypothetical protein SAMN06264364_10247 [Quadrisphaera granulorum]